MARFAVIVILCLLAASLSRADDGEWRAGAGGGAIVTTVSAGGAEGTGLGFEARGRLGRSLSNLLELGVFGSFAGARDVSFANAMQDGRTGTLYADVRILRFGCELRLTPGIALAGAFERTSPYVAARAGGALVFRSAEEILSRSNLLLAAPPDALGVEGSVEGGLGVEHRFGDHAFLTVEVSASWGANERQLALTSEVAWAWY